MPEQRASGRRTWVKLYCWGRLHGSVVYQLTEGEQSVWDKLLCLAGIIGREGQISDNDGRAFPRTFLSHELHTSEELLESTLTKCISEGRISENEGGLHITNWKAYQSEYERQKPYREAKRGQIQPNHTPTYEDYAQGKYGICPKCHQKPCICKQPKP